MKTPIQLLSKNRLAHLFCIILLFILSGQARSQMRVMSYDNNSGEIIRRASFYSPVEGYISYGRDIAFTADSGRSFTSKQITNSNVDFNSYDVNLTFGFLPGGVKAFDRNNVIVYGTYALVPAILRSQDGGNSFKLVFHSQYAVVPNSAVEDMVFPSGNQVGFAVDRDRILKTVDGGWTWTIARSETDADFRYIDAVDNNIITAISSTKALRTSNSGGSWQNINLPNIANKQINYVHFRTASRGWMSISSSPGSIYTTTDGGVSWVLQNDPLVTPFSGIRLKFIDDNNGYAIGGDEGIVYKTSDGGRLWEPFKRNQAVDAVHSDLFFLTTQQFWAVGSKEIVEMTTNGGGPTTPKAYFTFDTAQYTETGKVRLVNHSKPGYSINWLVNGNSVGTTDNVEYARNTNLPEDEIKLIVSNGTENDTSSIKVSFPPLVIVSSFTPVSAARGTIVTITGANFLSVTSVSFGGDPAQNFWVESEFVIKAEVGQGASGDVVVRTTRGGGKLSGFTFLPPPNITSFSPTSAPAGAVVTITGAEFGNATKVLFGGVEATSFTIVSTTTVRAMVPSGPSGYISVESPYGIGSRDGFISLPVITSFTPLHGTQGTIMTIEGTSFPEVNSVTIGGVPAQSFEILSSEIITAVVHTGATGAVTVSKTGGSSTLPGFTWYPPPVITSFNPASGPIGTQVTIIGQNFDATLANNTVFFGDVEATVTAATTTTLQVTVPAGASFEPVSVTNHNLTAYSHYPFVVTFSNGGSINPMSFNEEKVISVPQNELPTSLAFSDFDSDGKIDLAVAGMGSGMVIYSNLNTPSEKVFNLTTTNSAVMQAAFVASDLDGDGKPDIAIINDETIEVYRNTSAAGNINFQKQETLPSEFFLYGIALNDIDGDGKPDIAVNNVPDGGALLYRNTSNPGKITFAEQVKLSAPGGRNILLTDLDGDKKPDIILPNALDDEISVFKNNSVKGNFQFGNRVIIPGHNHSYIAAADFDKDGKNDIVVGDYDGKAIMVLKNNSTSSGLSFSIAVNVNLPSYVEGVTTGDLDGDGMPDIAVGVDDIKLVILKNTTTGGNISFGPTVEFTQGSFKSMHFLEIGDFDSDGRNDIVATDELSRTIHLYSNKVIPAPYIESFSPTSGLQGTTVIINGLNFTNASAVSFGGIPASSYTVNSATKITAVVSSGASGDVSVTNNFGTGIKSGFFFGNQLTISSFSPATGAAGSVVKISGTNFSITASDNFVYFGTARATVTSATASELQVIVPAAATYKPITVTVGGRTAYSVIPFVVTFPGAERSFTYRSFKRSQYEYGATATAIADIDGDGKSDLLSSAGTTGQILIAVNQSTPGVLSFGPGIPFTHLGGATSFATGDLNSDGKIDLVSTNNNQSLISIWQNNSSPGNVVLSAAINLPSGPGISEPWRAAIRDVDGDGKPDIVVANYTSEVISIFKNITNGPSLAFATRQDIPVAGTPTDIILNDVNGDGKTDMVISLLDINRVVVFQNNGAPGTIAFKTPLEFVLPAPGSISFTDLNTDGKPDIIATNTSLGGTSVLINESQNFNTAFRYQVLADRDVNSQVTSSDLDGDGMPDVVACNTLFGELVLSKNMGMSQDNNVVTEMMAIDMRNESPLYLSIGDLDGDGMPDMTVSTNKGVNVFFINITNGADTVSLCSGADTSLISNITGTGYKWQRNIGSGFINISDDENISGSNTSKLVIRNISSAWNGYEFRCIVDNNTSSRVFVIRLKTVLPPEVSIIGSDTIVCMGSRLTFTAASKNEGTMYDYIWKVNGNLQTTGPVYTFDAFTRDSVIIQLLLLTNAECRISDTVVSKAVVVKQYPRDTLEVQIAGMTNVVRGQSSLITAIVRQTQLPVTYQWQDSTKTNDWNDIAGETSDNIDYTPASTGDKLRCVITGNKLCDAEEVWSNILQFSVSDQVVITSEILKNNPVTNGLLVIDSLKLSDNWETLEILNSNTGQRQQVHGISGQTTLRLFVSGLSNGVYVAVLRSRLRPPLHFKFIKF